jgi:phosphoribosylanthranilate isomerase
MILKVCGITNQEDATAALAAGANAIGFNFYPPGSRYIDPERAAAISTGSARRVGVFVNESPGQVEEIARRAGLQVAQLHGEEVPADFPRGIAVWKAARVSEGFDIRRLPFADVEAVLLDGPAGSLYGGAGTPFDWRLATGSGHRVILAGGLDASNVARAVALAHPWGVDACSRIESSPGIKDHIKMTEFLKAARAALQP